MNSIAFFVAILLLPLLFSFKSDQKITRAPADMQALYQHVKSAYEVNDFSGALQYSVQFDSLLAKKKVTDPLIIDIEMMFAKSLYNLSNYERSLPIALKNLNQYQELGDGKGIADAQNLVGLIYLAQHHYEAALEEFKKSAKRNSALGNRKRLSANHLNMGLASSALRRLEDATTHYAKAKSLAEQSDYHSVQAMATNRLAEVYEEQNKVDTAMRLYQVVLLDTTAKSEWENSFAHTGIARCYYKQEQYEKAKWHALKGYHLAVKLKTKWDIQRAAKIVAESSAALGLFEDAFTYQLIFTAYKDSILSENKRFSLDSMQIDYQRSANRKLALEKNIVDHQLRIGQILVIFLISLTVFVLIIWYTARRHARTTTLLNLQLNTNSQIINERNELIEKQNEQLKDTNVTKDFLIAVLSHDLRAPMSSILDVINYIQHSDLELAEIRKWFNTLSEQTQSTIQVMDNLLLWTETQKNGSITKKTAFNIPELVATILQMMRHTIQQKNLIVLHDDATEAFGMIDRYHLHIIISNIIANAIKFTTEGGAIKITYEQSDQYLSIHISDNGIGMSAEKLQQIRTNSNHLYYTQGTNEERGFGVGMQIVTHFLTINSARLMIDSTIDKGSQFTIIIPKPN